MPSGLPFYRFLYLSRLAEGFDFSVFKPIAVRSRQRNPKLGISGVLLFDGERFCQLLEGEAAEVRALAALIEADPRHRDFVMLHDAAAGGRLCQSWNSGYCGAAEDLDALVGPDGLRGSTALSAFIEIAARADLSD